MRNSDDSPGSRHREHYYPSKSKRKDHDSDEDMNEDEKYRIEDLRTKLNELKKSKDHHRDRQSSSDRDHNKHRNSRQLQVHDYDTSYHKSNQSKREREPGSRDPYYSSYQQKGAHYYQQEHRSYTSDRHSSDKRSSKVISSTAEKYVEVDNKDKHKRSKMIIEAEVNEIVSEEEVSNESSNEEEIKQNRKSKSPESKKDSKEDELSDKEEQEVNENIQAEIELRNKLKRRIQQEAGTSHTEEDDKKESSKKVRKEADSASQSLKSTPRSCSTRTNPSDTDPDTRDASPSTKSNRSETTDSHTPERTSESLSESEKDELDEKIEDYYKKMAAKKRFPKPSSEETKQVEVEKKEDEEKPSEPMTPPLPINAPEIIMHYCASQGCRSVEEFECLNKIEEGAYGVVYRAKDKRSGEMVALKRLKMEKEKEGFPITSIREIDTLLKAQHPNVVTVREIVVGFDIDRIFMVMDYVEHDLKSLMQYSMKKPFMMSEVKTLMIQLLRGVAHLHDNWIIHRDLKTSNLLLSHKGVLKIADFGLAREYGSPLKEYTAVVVTLWYRCPELLLGAKKYSTPVDIWSVGCIFGELMLMKALFNGKNENDQLNKIFKDLGTPSEKIWPGFKELPLVNKLNFQSYPYNTLRSRFGNYLSDKGFELITKLLTYDPNRRISAEDALKHEFFKETPLPIDTSMFPTWPAKSEGLAKNKIPKDSEPRAPSPAKTYEKLLKEDEGFVLQFPTYTTGFQLR